MKYIKFAVMVFVLGIVTAMNPCVAKADEYNGFDYWIDDETNEVFICGYNGSEENLVIPDKIEDKTVYSVWLDCYYRDYETEKHCINTTIKTITIPEGIAEVTIDGCAAVENIIVDENNKNYTAVDGILYSKDMKEIVYYPSARTGEFEIPETVIRISNWAFRNSKINSVTIPSEYINNIKEDDLGEYINEYIYYIFNGFRNCVELEKINVGENEYIKSEDGIIYSKDGSILICCPTGRKGELILNDNVTNIKELAFYGCSQITKIVLGNNTKTIETLAFASCEGITELSIPDSVEYIGDGCFAECNNLKEIVFPKNAVLGSRALKMNSTTQFKFAEGSKYMIKDNCLIDTTSNKLVYYLENGKTTVAIPDYVETIGNYAFSDNSDISKIEVPASVETIEIGAFSDCSELKELILPEGITEIPDKMCLACEALDKCEIPSTVKKIGGYAFYGCDIKNIVISENVTEIGERAFGSSSIEKLYIKSDKLTTVGESAFQVWQSMTVTVASQEIYDILNGNKEVFGFSLEEGLVTLILEKQADPLELDKKDITLYASNVQNSAIVKATLNGITGNVKWSTSNNKVATVKNGKITAVAKGKAVISAKIGNNVKKVNVIVKNPSIIVADGSESITDIKVKCGKTVYYKIYITPAKAKMKLVVSSKTKKYVKASLKNKTLAIKGQKKGIIKMKLVSGKTVRNVKVKIY